MDTTVKLKKGKVPQINVSYLETPPGPITHKSNVNTLDYSKTTFTLTHTSTTNKDSSRNSKQGRKKFEKVDNFPQEITEELFASIVESNPSIINKDKVTQSIQPEKAQKLLMEKHALTPTCNLEKKKVPSFEIEKGISFGMIDENFDKISEKPEDEDEEVVRSKRVDSEVVDEDNSDFYSEDFVGSEKYSKDSVDIAINETKSDRLIFVEEHS